MHIFPIPATCDVDYALIGILGGGAVTIGAFDFDIGQQRTGNIAVAVHGCGGMTILAEKAAFGIALP